MDERDLRGTNIAFVGGSGGIGLAAAQAVARRGGAAGRAERGARGRGAGFAAGGRRKRCRLDPGRCEFDRRCG